MHEHEFHAVVAIVPCVLRHNCATTHATAALWFLGVFAAVCAVIVTAALISDWRHYRRRR